MASIPLPELDVKPIQQPDLMEQAGKVMQMRALSQQLQYQQQTQPLELQQKQLAVEQAQRTATSQKALQQALITNPTADPDELAQNAMKLGAYPGDVLPLVKQLKDNEEQTLKIRGDKLDQATKTNQALGDNAQMLLGIQDPDERNRAYQAVTMPVMQRLGIDPSQLPQTVPDEPTLKSLAAASTRADQQLTQARDQQKFELEHGVIAPGQLQSLNSMMANRYQIMHPGQALPQEYQLQPGTSWDQYNHIDKQLEGTERAAGTRAQFEQTYALRQQAFGLQALAAQERIATLNKPTPDEQRRYDMSTNLEENMNALMDITQRRPELFGGTGGINGMITRAKKMFGSDDPDVGALETLQHQIGMSQIAAHGMRGGQAVAAAYDSVLNNFKNGPDAIRGSVTTALNSAQTFRDDTDRMRSGRVSGITPQMGPLGGQVTANQQAAQQQQAQAKQNLPGKGLVITSAMVAKAAKDAGITYSEALQDAKSKGATVTP